ncbi:hypothetical protein PspLS_02948 [Pyricularia sp. CBS 133598]|nr:hypothetical protein PspLS_02948 [Pyricularia sp. CBS 133598]
MAMRKQTNAVSKGRLMPNVSPSMPPARTRRAPKGSDDLRGLERNDAFFPTEEHTDDLGSHPNGRNEDLDHKSSSWPQPLGLPCRDKKVEGPADGRAHR